jgi:hypothetical protein
MGRSPSCEANGPLACQEILRLFYGTEDSLPRLQKSISSKSLISSHANI